jgi:diacylglycerol kinase
MEVTSNKVREREKKESANKQSKDIGSCAVLLEG